MLCVFNFETTLKTSFSDSPLSRRILLEPIEKTQATRGTFGHEFQGESNVPGMPARRITLLAAKMHDFQPAISSLKDEM